MTVHVRVRAAVFDSAATRARSGQILPQLCEVAVIHTVHDPVDAALHLEVPLREPLEGVHDEGGGFWEG